MDDVHGAQRRLLVNAAAVDPGARVQALDAFRGIVVAGVILASAMSWLPETFRPLRHARWMGVTFADLGMPCFLLIVGVTTQFVIGRARRRGSSDGAIRRRALARAAVLIALGLLGNAFVNPDLATLRIPGVLQRIALSYVVALLIAIRLQDRGRVIAGAALLTGYWIMLTVIPVPSNPYGPVSLARPETTLAAWVDRAVFGGHLLQETPGWDPEGLLATLPAVATVLFGTIVGSRLERSTPPLDRAASLMAIGALATALGIMWGWSFPMMKGLWTSSYAVMTAGAGTLALGTLLWVIEVRAITWWTAPFVAFGVNPLGLYVGSVVVNEVLGLPIVWARNTLHAPRQLAYDAAFASWLPPKAASLAFGLATLCLWLGLALLARRRGWFLRV